MAIDNKFEHEHEHDIESLIEVGKEKGYLTYGDVNGMLPEEMGSSPKDLDALITTIRTQGIDSKRRTTRCACTCARWAPCPCLRARAR